MNFELFLAKRFLNENKKEFSQAALRLSILSIALGLAVMILSISIVTGFQISRYDFNSSLELPPIQKDLALVKLLKSNEEIKSISTFATKGGVIQGNGIIQGCVFKGVESTYDWQSMQSWLVKGKIPDLKDSLKSNEVLISKEMMLKLNLNIDSSFLVYFMQNPPRIRKFVVSGIYDSGFPDFDQKFIYGDLRHLQKINQWKDSQIAGYEVVLQDFKQIETQTEWIYDQIGYDLKVLNLNQRYPFIMDWLKLLDTNVYFILGLMILISGIGMIATLLILILEKTRFIGSLKAMGASNNSIRKIFVYHGIYLSAKGLLIGNLIGIGLSLLQFYFKIIPLDPQTYYMDAIPININWFYILSLNLGVLLTIGLMMWWPSHLISRISPIKAIRFE
jgi:lipoprotein-releasing system permease protein